MKKYLPVAFFVFTFLLGIFLFRDYGISWDEPIQNALGNANLNYVIHGSHELFTLQNYEYPPFIEMVENAGWRLFHITDPKTIFLFRHLVNYLIFWLGSIFLFLLGKEIFKSTRYAMLSVVILFLTPRIFAQSFYNSKDIALLSFFTISNYFLIRFLKKPSFKSSVILALFTGMTFGIRILGMLIPIFAIALFVLNILNGNIQKRALKFLYSYLILTIFFSLLFYPVLWNNPMSGIQQTFTLFSHFPYDDPQFFMGKLIAPADLPWYYIPVWMGITIPVMWQFFFLAGLCVVFFLVTKTLTNLFRESWMWMLILGWLLAPWLIVLVFNSVVYDEWRHLFFIYPAFILICVYGISKLMTWKYLLRLKIIIPSVIVIQSFIVLQFMIANHPFENVWFSSLAGKKPHQKFELDYWGLSYRQGLENLVKHAKEDTIKVCWQNAPGNYNLIWLSQKDRSRIKEVPYDSCEYFLTNFQRHPEQYTDSAWATIKSGNTTILAIEKLR